MNRPPLKILLVQEDKPATAQAATALKQAGYQVEVRTLRGAERRSLGVDLVLLGWDGLAVCRSIRRAGKSTPALMLTARDDIASKLEAFEAGVDDYVTVPFHDQELVARVGALLRRYDILWAGKLMLNVRERTAFWSAQKLGLTGREFVLLSMLVRNAGRVVRREEMVRSIFDGGQNPGSNVIDVHIRNLRMKLGAGAVHLKSVVGVGYCYQWDPATPARQEVRSQPSARSGLGAPAGLARSRALRGRLARSQHLDRASANGPASTA